MSTTPILVVGSGPSGLVLALTLLKNGVPVRIIEKDTQYHGGQRGRGIQPRSLELFHFLDTLPDIQAFGQVTIPKCIYELPGGTKPIKIFNMASVEDPTPGVPYPNPLLLGQSHTEEILRSELAKYNVHVELGTELLSFTQSADSVTARIAKREGSEEVIEEVHADWLVGADGAKGVVRKQLGLTFFGESRPSDGIIVGDIVIHGLDSDHWHSWGEFNTNFVSLRPTEYEGVFQLLAGGPGLNYDTLIANHEALKQFIRDTTTRSDLELGEIQWLSEFRPNIRMVNKFAEGRVFVVGDAAHVHSPTGGQGLNSSVQDSFNLGWKLAFVHKHLSPPSLLETYNIERLPVIKQMLYRTTAILDKAVEVKSADDHQRAWSRSKAMRQLGVNYRWSPIVVDEQTQDKEEDGGEEERALNAYGAEHGDSLCAGDRAPDAPGLVGPDGKETSLFNIYKPSTHTALIFPSTSSEASVLLNSFKSWPTNTIQTIVILSKDISENINVSGADLIVTDQHGHARSGYPVAGNGFPVVIIRPDGVIGAIVKGREGILEYLQGIFTV